jgi:Flp pilus assembly protein TadD
MDRSTPNSQLLEDTKGTRRKSFQGWLFGLFETLEKLSAKGCLTVLLLVYCLVPRLSGQTGTGGTVGTTEAPRPVRSARLALERGDPDEAIQLLSTYLSNHPSDFEARLTLGQSYAAAGQSESAIEQIQEALKLEPHSPTALKSLAEMYAHNGQFERAEPLLASAVQASHGDSQIRIEWAVALVRLHEYKKAQTALTGVSLPSDIAARVGFYRLKASISSGLGNSHEAASEMENALALKPNDAGLILATAAAQSQAKNFRRAAELAGPVFTATRDTAAGFLLLEAQLGAKEDFQSALLALRADAVNSPDELAIRQHLAELLVSYNEISESLVDFQRAVEIEPTRADLWFDLALAQFRAGQFDDAFTTAEKNKALGDTADLEDLIGDIDEARGDNVSAAKSYQAAIALSPNDEKYRLSLALELIRHKSFEAAKVVLEQARQVSSSSWRVELALGMVEYFLGNDQESSRILLHSAEISPEPAVALKYVGDIQMNQAAAPDAVALSKICKAADARPKETTMQYYCGALLFKKDYAAGSKTNMLEALRRLNAVAKQSPNDPSARCQLGKAYLWLEQWNEALKESEICVRLNPESTEGHYRLMQLYRRMGQTEHAKEEFFMYKASSKRVSDENTRREETIKTFLYTIEKQEPAQTKSGAAANNSTER